MRLIRNHPYISAFILTAIETYVIGWEGILSAIVVIASIIAFLLILVDDIQILNIDNKGPLD